MRQTPLADTSQGLHGLTIMGLILTWIAQWVFIWYCAIEGFKLAKTALAIWANSI